MRTLLVSSLFLMLGTASTHAALILSPGGDITGMAGSTIGWGFQFTSGPDWEAAVSSMILTDTNSGLGVYTDFIGGVGGPANGVNAPSTSWNQLFDAANGLGVGSFTIDPAAMSGDADSGTLEILLETFSADPNSCSTCATGFVTVDLPFSVTVTSQPVSGTPEPATFSLLAGGLLVALSWRYRPRSR